MNYIELKDLRKKYKGNAVMTIFGICIFFLIVAFSNPFLAPELVLVMSIVFHANIVLIILCALRIYLYLTDEMKEAWRKESLYTISRLKKCCLN